MIHYSMAEARKHFSEIVNRVKYEKIIIAVGHCNKDDVFIVPKPEFEEEIPVSHINAASPSFDFLEDEANFYSLKDIKKRYV